MKTSSRLLAASVAILVTLYVVGAGRSSAAGSKSGTRAGPDLAYVAAQVQRFRALPHFIAPGPPFDARKVMAGKTILSIPVSSANPFTENIDKAMRQIAKQIGFKFTEWSNQGQPIQWVQGVNAAINQRVNLIDMLGGTDPAGLQPQIKAARARGIKVVASHLYGTDQTPAPNLSGVIPFPYNQVGRLLADWVILRTRGKADVLVIESKEIIPTSTYMNGIAAEFKTRCGPSCTFRIVNAAVPDWSTKIQPQVQAAIIKDKNLNYVIPIYDSMSQFVVPAILLTRATGRVKIVTFNGTPFVLGFVQQGSVEMDAGENLDWIAHAILDQEMRIIGGLPAVKDEHIPVLIFDKSNANTAGIPPQINKGYGNAYVDGYNRLWRLST